MIKRLFTQRPRNESVFRYDLVSELNGILTLKISGEDVYSKFRNESGGHRWQRKPPNERRGRVHSSTITVAVLRDKPVSELQINENDCEISTCRGSGPGGQLRNKTDSAVQIKHIPTGLIVRCESERSQHQNKQQAFKVLKARLQERSDSINQNESRIDRLNQIGSGERSDKVRTVQVQNGQVVNHINGKKTSIDRYLKGDIWCLQ